MTHLLPLTVYPDAQTIATIIEITIVSHNIILFLYHIYRTLKWNKIKNRNKISALQYLSFLNIFWCITSGLYFIGISFDLKPVWMSCHASISISTFLYSLSKYTVYVFFLERLFIVFTISIYQYSARTKHVSRFVLILYLCSLNLSGYFLGNYHYIKQYGHKFCIGLWPFYVRFLFAIIPDLLFISSLSILLTRKLMLATLNQYTSNLKANLNSEMVMENLKHDPYMLNMMQKFTVLTITSLFTTFMSMILSYIFALGSVWMSIDSIINNWCIILMFKHHEKLYRFIKCSTTNSNLSVNCLSWVSFNACCPVQIRSTKDESNICEPDNNENNNTFSGHKIQSHGSPVTYIEADIPKSVLVTQSVVEMTS